MFGFSGVFNSLFYSGVSSNTGFSLWGAAIFSFCIFLRILPHSQVVFVNSAIVPHVADAATFSKKNSYPDGQTDRTGPVTVEGQIANFLHRMLHIVICDRRVRRLRGLHHLLVGISSVQKIISRQKKLIQT